MHITLHWRIPSKKNWRSVFNGRLITNKSFALWEKLQLVALKEQEVIPMGFNEPLEIRYAFRWPDERKTDMSNKIESINDMFVKYWLLEDDNQTIIKCIKSISMWKDKNNPRCEIFINLYTWE